jgi:hypothetical protein
MEISTKLVWNESETNVKLEPLTKNKSILVIN